MSISKRGRPQRIAAAGILLALGAGSPLIALTPASAAVSTVIAYSTDGGSTWTAAPSVASGGTVLVRVWYNNSDTTPYQNTQVTTTLPAGFSLVSGSTIVCLNPSTPAGSELTPNSSETVCNTSSGQSGAINEAAAWTGSSLAIAPTAGLFGQSTGLTSGIMEIGKTRYLNLEQCTFKSPGNTFENFLPNLANAPFEAGTATSNTAAASVTCGTGSGTYPQQPVNSAAEPLDLLGQRYVNLEQCTYINTSDTFASLVTDLPNTPFETGTDTSNGAATSPTCGPGTGYVLQPANSGAIGLNLLGERYINLEQCTYDNGSDTFVNLLPDIANAPFEAGTSTSNTPVSGAPTCGAGDGGYPFQAGNSGASALDTLDTSRGAGYVQFSMTAPIVPTTTNLTQTAGITGNGTGDPTGTGEITVSPVSGVPVAGLAGTGAGLGILLLGGLGWHRSRRRAALAY
jgi:hypothetical protein